MALLITNIKELVQVEESPVSRVCGKDMSVLNTVKNAWLLIEGDRISDFGTMNNLASRPGIETIDAAGRIVLPSFCDSHTHLVYAGSREMEYVDKIRGLSYEEIAKRGGGILNSAKLLRETSDEVLFDQAMARLNEIMMLGTGAVEIKSGYGLTSRDEIRMLRVIRKLKERSPLTITATFLGLMQFRRNSGVGRVNLSIL